MRIAYIAQHRSGDWDEGSAITFALRQLGHIVCTIAESGDWWVWPKGFIPDFVLFHHCNQFERLKLLPYPKVFWNFDLVDFPDPALAESSARRKEWMRQATEIATVGFCNDGDWVDKDTTGKLFVLKEGVDSRYAGKGVARPVPWDILFVGSSSGATGRQSFVKEMRERWGARFYHVGERHNLVWTRELADLIASAKIVVAPDCPITDRYWSNRVYVTLGYGGFLLHPRCRGVSDKLGADGWAIRYYADRQELHEKLEEYLAPEWAENREEIATRGLVKVLSKHTFLHRCAEMVEIVQESL
jgi:hypothetical protein